MTKVKATKKLTDIDFSGKDAAVALVGKSQGGAANNFTTLVIKSAKYTDEHIEKASKIKITLDIVDFMTRFYGLWHEDAEILAQALGYSTDKSEDEYPETYEDYIASQVSAIEVIKQLGQSEDINKSLSDLDPEDYLAFLKSQETLEKAFKKIDKAQSQNSKTVAKAAINEDGEATAKVVINQEVTTKNVEASPSDAIIKNKETPMTKEVKVVETDVTVEMVEKSALDSIQKALAAQTEELNKALEVVKQFEKEKQEAIQKSRKDLLTATVKETEKVEALFKAFANVESEEVYKGAIAVLESLMQVQKSSDLFKEVGASAQAEQKDEEGALMKLAKAAAAKASK